MCQVEAADYYLKKINDGLKTCMKLSEPCGNADKRYATQEKFIDPRNDLLNFALA